MGLSIRFWGTRGSIPSPGFSTVRYGGNTPCVEVRTSTDWLIILDAGTGIRELGRSLMAKANGKPIEGDIFLTHAHWDHIQGIPFFAPIFGSGNHFVIWGSKSLEKSVDQIVRDQMSPVVFPVTFEELDATIDFKALAEEECEGDGFAVKAMQVRHPGGALGYRFTDRGDTGGALVYISDNELNLSAKYEAIPAGWRESLVEFTKGAKVLVHDATYTKAEYQQHRGWGHSTYHDVVELASDAQVETLVLFHHKPERTDDEIDRCVNECRELAASRGSSMRVIAAAEGLTLTV
jgi:phosphoribosyl 1,2-cyclic phosphodiesterase